MRRARVSVKAVCRGVFLVCLAASMSRAQAPPQRLPSAVLQWPLIVADAGTRDTRVELVNLTSRQLQVHCFYVHADFCGATNFFVYLTPNQPMSWLASRGTNNRLTGSAVPPFFGTGELKCV